ncbi:YbaB/EbfC family nucleoid-associated protein [Nonomuraea sp. NPDC049152]|uniref:YbaB/EbfC family nucleoid-associated protein n=1 Tax=Nonomuraea sp. NPDC049152 TaxID=3154350 RepID=UPI0033C783DF
MDNIHHEDLDRVILDTERQMRDVLAAMNGLSEITGAGESRSGLVHATVDAEGKLTDVKLSGRAMRLEGHELAEEIIEAVRAAQENHDSNARSLFAMPVGGKFDAESLNRMVEDLQDSFLKESGDRIARMRDRLA